jgi:transposase
VIAAIGVSPKREHWNAWSVVYEEALTASHVQAFLSMLLRKIPGKLILLWDRGSIHRDGILHGFLIQHSRMEIYEFSAYTPDLNPAEPLWNILKERMRHFAPQTIDQLHARFRVIWKEVVKSKTLLRSCIQATPLKHP